MVVVGYIRDKKVQSTPGMAVSLTLYGVGSFEKRMSMHVKRDSS